MPPMVTNAAEVARHHALTDSRSEVPSVVVLTTSFFGVPVASSSAGPACISSTRLALPPTWFWE